MTKSVGELASRACAEIAATFGSIDESAVSVLVEELAAARRIALHGVGREGLMMRALTMRLFHMGLDAHPVGDMTTPAIGPGDLLVVSAGPGEFSTIMALIGVARDAGARVAVITAQPEGGLARVLVLPDDNRLPASGAQLRERVGVPVLDRGELRGPPVDVRLGHREVVRAAVPEASVHKDCNPATGQDKVWRAPFGELAMESESAAGGMDGLA